MSCCVCVLQIKDLSPLEKCSQLSQLNISGLKKVTSCSFLRNKPYLRELNAHNCQQLFASGGLEIVSQCSELIDLNISYIKTLDVSQG